MSIKRERIKVYEMTCTSCENRVEKAVKRLEGVILTKASYAGQYVDVQYDDGLCNSGKIRAAIKTAGYSTQGSNDYKFMGILIVVAAIVLLGLKTSGFDMESRLVNASYTVLFAVGVLTSIHCVGMCGGIMLSQTLSRESKNRFEAIQPALLYNAGRVVSYTILGGIIGALGSVFSLSITAKAIMQIFAGAFMIMMGFNMAGFTAFRKFQIKLPMPGCSVKSKSGSPLLVGLLNGLMPCGPLQTMQLFALGTGSAAKGALSMFMFSLGTVPLMLTFGAVSGILSKGYTKKILKFSGVLIIVLGLIMGNRGMALAGININPIAALITGGSSGTSNTNSGSSKGTSASGAKAVIKDGVQVLTITADSRGYTPRVAYVQKGIPVKWIINGKQLNSCNNAIAVKALNKQVKLKSGENVIEFTPGSKDINYSCWMGMIRGVIRVVDNLDSVEASSSGSGSGSEASGQSSIYGNDISKVPTETLVNKALAAGKYQSARFKGIGYELQPLIVVTGSGSATRLTFDLSSFEDAEGEYQIVDVSNGEEVASFTGKKGINEVEINPQKAGGYAIIIDNSVLGIIEVVDNLKDTNLDTIRNKYIR